MAEIEGEYEPSPAGWVRDQVERYERSGVDGPEVADLAEVDHALVGDDRRAPAGDEDARGRGADAQRQQHLRHH